MNTAQETAIAHYLGKGLSKDVAVGLTAVLYVESALNPGSQGKQSTETPGALNPSGAYGIASWNGPRQAALQAFATKYGRAVGDLITQLDFVLTESANSYPTVWKAITSASTTYTQMIQIMVDDYEVPADKSAEIDKAITLAQTLYSEQVAPQTSTMTPTPAPAPAQPTPAPAQSLRATIAAQVAVAVLDVFAANGINVP